MKHKLIYESKKPSFAVFTDDYQWILARRKDILKNGKSQWSNKFYYPRLDMLLDDLKEQLFRDNAQKIEELKDLEKAIARSYRQVDFVEGILTRSNAPKTAF